MRGLARHKWILFLLDQSNDGVPRSRHQCRQHYNTRHWYNMQKELLLIGHKITLDKFHPNKEYLSIIEDVITTVPCLVGGKYNFAGTIIIRMEIIEKVGLM